MSISRFSSDPSLRYHFTYLLKYRSFKASCTQALPVTLGNWTSRAAKTPQKPWVKHRKKLPAHQLRLPCPAGSRKPQRKRQIAEMEQAILQEPWLSAAHAGQGSPLILLSLIEQRWLRAKRASWTALKQRLVVESLQTSLGRSRGKSLFSFPRSHAKEEKG